jgi:nicotinamidase-related amidase
MKKVALEAPVLKEKVSLRNSLIDVDDSTLIVIDVQESFLMKYSARERELLVSRIGWLVNVAARLNVPVVAMAEDIPRCGSVVPSIAEKLPPDTHIHNKMVFGLAADPEILAAVKNTRRKTAVLVGLETDVCVAHSAIGLIQNDFQVVVVADATGSPGVAHDIGLERMRGAGVLVSSVKSLYYEWIRTVDRDNEFGKRYGEEIGRPGGITL